MHDLIIIGAGPAGLTAGLYAARFGLKTVIIEKMSVGGQILLSPGIENFPGFPESIPTGELVERFRKQVTDLGVRIESEEALEIAASKGLKNPIFGIKAQEKSFEAKSLIIATGAQYKKLGVEGEEKFIGRGVSYCGTCDGPMFKNKEIAVVGGGDRAIEEAIFLTGYASKVSLIHRRAQLRASKVLEDKARRSRKIDLVLDSVIEEVTGENKVNGVNLKNVKTGAKKKLFCEGVFIFVGIAPDTGIVKKLLDLDEKGFIITDNKMKSSKDGIFACGDCREKSLYQVVTACADGATAADSAHKYLLNR
ncbi:thioredoxin-disulfide reductase [Candidatus Omnitrophota bacterium]